MISRHGGKLHFQSGCGGKKREGNGKRIAIRNHNMIQLIMFHRLTLANDPIENALKSFAFANACHKNVVSAIDKRFFEIGNSKVNHTFDFYHRLVYFFKVMAASSRDMLPFKHLYVQ